MSGARITVTYRVLPTGTWRFSIPRLGLTGDGPSRATCEQLAFDAIRERLDDSDDTVWEPFMATNAFFWIDIQEDPHEPLTVAIVQEISLHILHRRWLETMGPSGEQLLLLSGRSKPRKSPPRSPTARSNQRRGSVHLSCSPPIGRENLLTG